MMSEWVSLVSSLKHLPKINIQDYQRIVSEVLQKWCTEIPEPHNAKQCFFCKCFFFLCLLYRTPIPFCRSVIYERQKRYFERTSYMLEDHIILSLRKPKIINRLMLFGCVLVALGLLWVAVFARKTGDTPGRQFMLTLQSYLTERTNIMSPNTQAMFRKQRQTFSGKDV